jgi:hypothetical protein
MGNNADLKFKISIYLCSDPGVDVRIILRWIFRKCDGGGKHRLDLAGLG